MAFELPPLSQKLEMDVSRYVSGLEKSVEHLDKFRLKVGKFIKDLEGVTDAKDRFEGLAGGVLKYVQALDKANKRGLEFADTYNKMSRTMTEVFGSPAGTAGLINRTRTLRGSGFVGPILPTDIERLAQQQIAADRKAQKIVDFYFSEKAARVRLRPFGPYTGPLTQQGVYAVGEGTRGATAAQMREVFGRRYVDTSYLGRFQNWMGEGGFGARALGGLGRFGAAAGGALHTAAGVAAVGAVGLGVGAVGAATFGAVAVAERSMERLVEYTKAFAQEVIQAGAALERWRVTFEVLTGGQGGRVVSGLQQLARETPIGFEGWADASQILLGMGVRAENLLGIMSRLGDVALGDAGRLRRLATVFGEVEAEGKLTGWRIRQLASLGVGIEDMAKTVGVPSTAFRALVGANLVPGDIVTKTLERLTEPGGRFNELNKKVLGTVSGQWGRAENVVQQLMAKAGEAFLGSSNIAGRVGVKADWLSGLEETVVRVGDRLGRLTDKILSNFEGVEIVIAHAFGGDPTKGLADGIDRLTEGVDRFVDRAITGAAGFAKAFARAINFVRDRWQSVSDTLNSIDKFAGQLHANVTGPIAGTAGDVRQWDYATGRWVYAKPGQAAAATRPATDSDAEIDRWTNKLLNRPRGGVDAIRKEFGITPSAMSRRRPDWENPLVLSATAKEIETQIITENFGGKAKGYGAAETPFRQFAHEMAAIHELEWKGATRDAIRTGGTIAGGLAVAGLTTYGNVTTGSPYSYLTERNQGALRNWMKLLPEESAVGREELDRRRFGGFLKLRQAYGGTISDNLPALAEYGSAAALETINKTNADNRGVMDEMLSVAQAALDSDRQREELFREFLEALKVLPADIAKIFERGAF